ncbi:hypothetical protein M2321_001467 [Rhodoblastus acidophilus]|nr:hypothetical protein [Rhodoblastus acidophilus]
MARIHNGNLHFSRRAWLIGGISAGWASALLVGEAGARAKLSKEAVRFSAAATDGKTCRSCALFVEPSSCTFVEGTIDPNGSCWIWRAKDG